MTQGRTKKTKGLEKHMSRMGKDEQWSEKVPCSRSTTSRLKEIIIPLYSDLVMTPLGYCFEFFWCLIKESF